MNRGVLLLALAAFVCGPLVALFGRWRSRITTWACPHETERRLWRGLWLPLVPAVVAASLLIGWALQEPQVSDERLRAFVYAVALWVGLIWLRALSRAVFALGAQRWAPAATIGLIRPRVVIAPELAHVLDAAALAAVDAHETAHARHYDPLRLWLAQLVTDVQWPAHAAVERQRRWRSAMEIARDAEACAAGVEGPDLAAAVVAAARLQRGERDQTIAFVDGGDFAARVERLLSDDAARSRSRSIAVPVGLIATASACAMAIAIGYSFGEVIIRFIPGVIG